MHDIALIVALAPALALFVALAAIGLAWITHGDEGAEGVTQRLLIQPIHKAADQIGRLVGNR